MNARSNDCTDFMFQQRMSWLKTLAPSKMDVASVRDGVSQYFRGELNEAAPLNRFFMLVTEEVFQDSIFWLKATAFSKTLVMSVTEDVFHVPIG